MFIFSKKINFNFLFRIFFLTRTRTDLFKQNNKFENQKLIIFNKSRWSLLFIIFLYKKLYKKENINIWVPSYYCNYALSKIRKTFPKVNFIFYPIRENFESDIKILNELNKNHEVNIFINVHFFGKKNKNVNLLNFYKKNNSWLINDCTHCLNPSLEFERFSDFSLYSPHKFYSIPSGAICKINFKGISEINKNNTLENIDLLKKEFLKELNLNSLKYKFKDLAFNFIWFLKRFVNIFYDKIKIEDFNQDPIEQEIFIENKPFPGIFIKKIIINTISFDKSLIDNRERTFLLWKFIVNKLLDKVDYEYISNENDNNQSNYNLIIKSNQKNIKKIYNILSTNNIPVSTWPDLAPEIKNKTIHDKTIELRNTCIFINLHPQIKSQLKYIKKLNFDKNFISNNLSLIKIDSENQWSTYLEEVNYSYITLLSKYYKNSKLFKSEKFLIENNGDKIAIFQTYTINLGKIIFVRVNFGPSYFRNLRENEKKNIVNFIISNLYKDKLKFFYLSPNLNLNENNIFFASKKNPFIFSGKSWESIYINLSDDIGKLKKNLKSNLRRDIIKKNKNKKFKLKKIESQNEFNKFIEYYLNQIKNKNFKGISINTLKSLYENKNLYIINALIDDRVISSVCIGLHGRTATYLVGFNLDKTNSANDLLLWKVIVFLKKNKYKFFDLGGIDLISNRNVSFFKSNFGGNRYKLVGSKFLIR